MSDAIDPSAVQWDDEMSSATPSSAASEIDASQVKWDDEASTGEPITGEHQAPTATSSQGMPNLADEMLYQSQHPSNAVLGARAGLSDIGSGVKQIAMHIGNHLGLVSDDDLAKNQAQIDYSRKHPDPALQTTGGQLGYMAGQTLPMLLAPEVGVPGAVAEGAAIGAAQPTATGESHLENAALGAAGGAGGSLLGKGIQAAAQPIKNALGTVGQAAVDTLTKAGIPLDLAQQTGSRVAKTLKNIIADNPLIGPSAFPEEQQHAFNRAVLRTMGITDPSVTVANETTLDAGKGAITDVMDDIGDRTTINYDDLEDRLAQIEKDAPGQLSSDALDSIKHNLNTILSSAANNNGTIPGAVFQKLRSNLAAWSKDPRTAPVSHEIQNALDEALQSAAAPGDQEKLLEARRQYRAMKQITDAVDPATGNVNPATLINRINTKDNRNQALFGHGDQTLVELAKAAKNVLGARNPDSGTARRLAGMAAMGAIAGSGDELIRGDPHEAIKVGVLGAALPWAGRQLVENPKLVNAAVKWNQSPGISATTGAIRKGLTATGAAASADADRQPAQIQRATGGKVSKPDMEALVTRLMNRWKAAKRATDETTKPLLKLPDAAIVRALDVAQEHI